MKILTKMTTLFVVIAIFVQSVLISVYADETAQQTQNLQIFPFLATPLTQTDTVKTYNQDGTVLGEMTKQQILVTGITGQIAKVLVPSSDGKNFTETCTAVSDILINPAFKPYTALLQDESVIVMYADEDYKNFQIIVSGDDDTPAELRFYTVEPPKPETPAETEKESTIKAPVWTSSAYNEENPFAQLGYYGQCTWYAWGRAYEVTGRKLPIKCGAKSWITAAKSAGLTVSDVPRAKSVVIFIGSSRLGGYGHAAYVENADNGYITFSDANRRSTTLANHYKLSSGIKQYDGTTTVAVNQMNRFGTVLGYIYI
jgi:surface antigen